MRTGTLAALAIGLLAPVGLAQSPVSPLEPEVTFPDARIEDPVKPLGEPGQTTLTARIECPPDETPLSVTEANLIADGPAFVDAIVSPSTQSFAGRPVECRQQPHELEASFSAALDQNAPAFETIRIPVELFVNRTSQDGTPERSHGPYHANVSVPVGYLPLINVRVPDKQVETEPGGEATFELQVDNFSNGRSRFTVHVVDGSPGLELSPPDPVEAPPNASEDLRLTARDTGEGPADRDHTFRVEVRAASTNPSAEDTANRTQKLRVTVDAGPAESLQPGSDGSPSPVPGPGSWAAAVLGLAALARARF